MIELGLYQAENIPYFKKFELDLSKRGVTIIRGKNLNAKNLKDRNNGSGKTLLLSGIAELIMNSNPSITRNENFARKALFPYKNSKISLEINKTLFMKGRFNSASVNYSIETDNGSLEKVKKDVALEHLFDTIGYNEDLFYTLVYLDGGREFPLISGTSVQRMQFLSNVFPELEVFENFFNYFTAKLRDVNKQVQTVNILETELSEMSEDLSEDTDMQLKSDKIAALSIEVSNKSKELKELSGRLQNAEMSNTYKKLKSEIQKLVDQLGIPYKKSREKYQYYLDNARKDEEYREWVEKGKRLKRKVTKLTALVDELELSDLDDSALSKSSNKYSKLPSQILEGMLSVTTTLNLPTIVGAVTNAAKARDLIKYIDYIMFRLNPESNVLRKEPISVVGKKLSPTDSINLEAKLNVVKDHCHTIIDLNLDISETEETVSEKDISKAKRARRNKRLLKSAKEDLDYYTDQYDALKKQSVPKADDLLDEDSLSKLKRLAECSETFSVIGFTADTTQDLDSLMKQYRRVENELSELKDTLNELKVEYNFLEENESTLKTLKSKIKSLSKYKNAQAPLEVLKQAFSNKGLRVALIHQLAAERLATSMNDSSHLTFPEPIKFRFDVTDKTCDIFAIRNPNTDFEMESDIRVLSLSERKSFNLLLMYCLLPFIPNKRRFNTVFMDEMVANMDIVTRTKIFREFIPALRERVPHIVIADTGTLEIDDSAEYWVVKKGKESKLVPFDEIHEYED